MRPISEDDVFPEIQSNVVPIPVSLGTFNALQQSDIHSYWEFNPKTNWIFPHYERPFTGGVPGTFEVGAAGAGALTLVLGSPSTIPGPGPSVPQTIRSSMAMIRTIHATRIALGLTAWMNQTARNHPIRAISRHACVLSPAG